MITVGVKSRSAAASHRLITDDVWFDTEMCYKSGKSCAGLGPVHSDLMIIDPFHTSIDHVTNLLMTVSVTLHSLLCSLNLL